MAPQNNYRFAIRVVQNSGGFAPFDKPLSWAQAF